VSAEDEEEEENAGMIKEQPVEVEVDADEKASKREK